MKTVSVNYNVYKYDELSDEAKQHVKQWYLNDPDRCYIFEDDLKYNLESFFGKNNDLHVQFSLGYCQGDGVNIYGSVSVHEIVECLENTTSNTMFEEFANMLTSDEKKAIVDCASERDAITLPTNRHYCYCMSDYIDLDDWYDSCYCKDYELDTETLVKFQNVVRGMFGKLCKSYEEWGYDYFYEIDDAEMNDLCEANEWEFLENGNLF